MEHGNEWCAAWPQKYPVELRERAVRTVPEVREETGAKFGAVARIAKQLGIGTESLRNWVNQAEVDSGRRRRRARTRSGSPSSNATA